MGAPPRWQAWPRSRLSSAKPTTSVRQNFALIENVQRSDLNPIERANAFRTLMTRFQMTQSDVADRVGMDRSSVANMMRLLDLPDDVRALIANGTISAGHGKMLASISDAQQQRRLVERILAEHLSVRQTERAVREIQKQNPQPRRRQRPSHPIDMRTYMILKHGLEIT